MSRHIAKFGMDEEETRFFIDHADGIGYYVHFRVANSKHPDGLDKVHAFIGGTGAFKNDLDAQVRQFEDISRIIKEEGPATEMEVEGPIYLIEDDNPHFTKNESGVIHQKRGA